MISRSRAESGRTESSGSASTRSRIAGSRTSPHLTDSARPATRSLRGSVSSAVRSHSTPAGSWKAPTRFLPASVLMPVLPPTAASTMPSTVVGTCTTRTPRSHVAATKPARSVVDPPPMATIASVRVKPACPRTDQQKAATSGVFAASPSGTSRAMASRPSATRSSRTASAVVASATGAITATRRQSCPNSPRNSPSRP